MRIVRCSEHSQAETLFCFKYWRTVGADNVVSEASQRLQIGADTQRRSYAHARVEVHERLDGSLAVYHAGRCLSTTPAPAEAPLCARPHGATRHERASRRGGAMSRKQTVPSTDRRQQILDAALEIFAEQGFESATNKAIAERAEVESRPDLLLLCK